MHSRRIAGGLAAIAAAGVIAVFAGIPAFRELAFAQSGQGQTPKEPTFACSIKVPSGTKDADVQKLAKISDAQARDAAQKAVAGTVVRSEIENENGCAVYGVEIKSADGKVHDIKVDAGTGTVVHQEVGKGSAEHEGGKEEEQEEQD